jgi:hypothetical protein
MLFSWPCVRKTKGSYRRSGRVLQPTGAPFDVIRTQKRTPDLMTSCELHHLSERTKGLEKHKVHAKAKHRPLARSIDVCVDKNDAYVSSFERGDNYFCLNTEPGGPNSIGVGCPETFGTVFGRPLWTGYARVSATSSPAMFSEDLTRRIKP